MVVKFFGKLEGQTFSDVMAEVATLTDQGLAELVKGIENETLTY
jgi:hypothetical protein